MHDRGTDSQSPPLGRWSESIKVARDSACVEAQNSGTVLSDAAPVILPISLFAKFLESQVAQWTMCVLTEG